MFSTHRLDRINYETKRRFTYLWEKFNKLYDDDKDPRKFLTHQRTVSSEPDFYREKIVLDVDCGVGRLLDLSNAVKHAKKHKDI